MDQQVLRLELVKAMMAAGWDSPVIERYLPTLSNLILAPRVECEDPSPSNIIRVKLESE